MIDLRKTALFNFDNTNRPDNLAVAKALQEKGYRILIEACEICIAQQGGLLECCNARICKDCYDQSLNCAFCRKPRSELFTF